MCSNFLWNQNKEGFCIWGKWGGGRQGGGSIENKETGGGPPFPSVHCSENEEVRFSKQVLFSYVCDSCGADFQWEVTAIISQPLQGKAKPHFLPWAVHKDWLISQILTNHLLFARHCGRLSSLVRKETSVAIQERKGRGGSHEEQRTDLGDISEVRLVKLGDGLNVEG